MCTLITPTGIAIEGGNSGTISKHSGSHHKNLIDQFITIPFANGHQDSNGTTVNFSTQFTIPAYIPPGIYRLRFDFGVICNKRRWSLNKEGFANRQRDLNMPSALYSPFLLCSNNNIQGKFVDAATIAPKTYWILLGQYNSNGYQGVIADEDKRNFALSSRNIIPDEIILPMYNTSGNIISYNLEPSFPTNTIDKLRNIPLDYTTVEKNRPTNSAVKLSLKNQQTFSIVDGLLIEGTTTAELVYYTIIMPGAVIEQGTLSVVNGRFFYRFDPALVNQRIPIYDIENRRTAHKDMKRIIHFTFFTAEKTADGSQFHSYARVIMRGNTAIYAP